MPTGEKTKQKNRKLDFLHRQETTSLPEPGLLSQRKVRGTSKLHGYLSCRRRKGLPVSETLGARAMAGITGCRTMTDGVHGGKGSLEVREVGVMPAGISYPHCRRQSRQAGRGVITEGMLGQMTFRSPSPALRTLFCHCISSFNSCLAVTHLPEGCKNLFQCAFIGAHDEPHHPQPPTSSFFLQQGCKKKKKGCLNFLNIQFYVSFVLRCVIRTFMHKHHFTINFHSFHPK